MPTKEMGRAKTILSLIVAGAATALSPLFSGRFASQMRSGLGVSSPVQGGVSAFSLIELLSAVAILGLLTAVAMPAFSSIKRGVDVGQSAYQLAEILEMARTHAIANNRRVEVGFQSDAEGLSAIVIANRTGETNFVSLMKVRQFPGLRFDQVPAGSPVRPKADVQFSTLAGGLSKFSFRGKDFDRVIQFNNRGEACVATNTMHRIIEIDLLPNVAGTTPASLKGNTVAIQISGLSGGVAVYRP